MRLVRMLLLLAGLLVPLTASAQGARFDNRSCDPRWCDESGWLFDDSLTDHTTSWRHDLGVVPRRVEILFTPDPSKQRVAPLTWSWAHNYSGNPVSIEMGRRAVHLHINAGAPLHGIWRPGEGWEVHREGYWKIIVYK